MQKNNLSDIKKILVHCCCAPCATYSFEKLINDGFKPIAFFYNPNIHPDEEYSKRLNELEKFCTDKNYELIVKDSNPDNWLESTKNFKNESEGGARCSICFKLRLEQTALHAIENNLKYFTTVLTISPHKNAHVINDIGRKLDEKYKITFIEENFKKNDGFKKSLIIAKEYNLFRQTYCGCTYSMKSPQP